MRLLTPVLTTIGMTVALFAVPAFARDVKVTADETIVTVQFPDAWEISDVKRGIQANTPDEEIYVWIETVPQDATATLQKEHDDYFEKEGVKITSPNPPMKAAEIDGHKWAFIEPQATYEGEPTVIRYIIINPGHPSGKLIVFTYWASAEGDKAADPEMNKILDSLKASIASIK
jgi:hypothetical protein